jgi:assimilatory nitrate reductase catalytic subunit
VIVRSDGARIAAVRGDPDHPANRGRLCTKGESLLLTLRPETRLLHPELRPMAGARVQREHARVHADWEPALEAAAAGFARIIGEHGPDSVAFYVSGQLLTEDYYVFNKLARAVAGTNNIDTNSRLCMSSAVSAYKLTLGADAPPACYEDIDHADCIVIAGANMAYAHPVLFRRIEAARARRPAPKLIVIDPRRTDTAAQADLHLALLPGSDVALFNGMLHVLLWEGLIDASYIARHTEGFDPLKAVVSEYTPRAVAQLCGLRAEDIVQAARWFGGARAALSLYCQGLNQSVQGTEKNATLINLHLACGQVGRPGAGPLSLTGQPNAMGGRETGGMATLLPGHRDPADPADRDEVARAWGVPALPVAPGLTAIEVFEALHAGRVKAVWIACTNPVQSLPGEVRAGEALAHAELVVVQEAFAATETTPYADVLLPAATWGEKQGTVTNSERCVSRVRAAVPPPGEARADWRIAADFALRLGRRLGREVGHLFAYATPQDIFDEHRALTAGRDLDMTGLSYALLEASGPQQWPLPAGRTQGAQRLYVDGKFPTPNGRARFVAAAHRATAERTDARHPLHLSTGRLRDQWHGMSRTGSVARLFAHAAEPRLSMHAGDMGRRGLRDGDLARVTSRRGALVLRVQASDELQPAQAWLPMHWGRRFLTGGSNALTLGAFDPISKQPEFKHAAVQVEKLDWRWELVALRVSERSDHLQRVQPLLERFPHASCGLLGRERTVTVLRAAAPAAVAQSLIDQVDAALDLNHEAGALDYRDARRGVAKRVLLHDGALVGARLSGETAAHAWLADLMEQGVSVESLRGVLLAPAANPAAVPAARGRVLCNCFDVTERDARTRLAQGCSLEALQSELKCGTQCGSCLPELRRLSMAAGAAA